jgi:AraC family transcriptional regulator
MTAGGLSVWQKKVATEIIDAHLASGLELEYVASLCGLRVSQFAHAFKHTVGYRTSGFNSSEYKRRSSC